jgi:pyruvate kinase
MEALAVSVATEESFARAGDHLVITAGLPLHTMGPTNVMRLVQVPHGQLDRGPSAGSGAEE